MKQLLEDQIEQLRRDARNSRAEVERLRKWEEAGKQFLEERDALRIELERALALVKRLQARVESAHLLCAAYPLTCPDCGYEWKSGWNRAITDEEYESLGLTAPERGESFEAWFRKNFGDGE